METSEAPLSASKERPGILEDVRDQSGCDPSRRSAFYATLAAHLGS